MGKLQFHTFLTLTLDGGKLSASSTGRFNPQRKNPWYTLDRRLGGPSWHDIQLKHRVNFTFYIYYYYYYYYFIIIIIIIAWSRIFLVKLTVAQLVTKFPAIFGNRKLVTV
jgi:hypothetical protein